MHGFDEVISLVGRGVEAGGVAVIVIGAGVALVRLGQGVRRGEPFARGYSDCRQGIGRALLLGLELLVAADIIRTVATSPTFYGLGVLAAIIAIRTFLSLSLEVEIEGRLPWQARPHGLLDAAPDRSEAAGGRSATASAPLAELDDAAATAGDHLTK